MQAAQPFPSLGAAAFRPLQMLPVTPSLGAADPSVAAAVGAGAGFAGELSRFVDQARERDVVAQNEVEAFARGDNPGRLHEAMVAVSKAEISLRTLATVRSKLVEAYRELLHVTA